MKLNLNSVKETVVDGIVINTRRLTDTFELNATFSDSEKAAVKTAAKLIERLHTMDGDRMGWIATLLEKVVAVINAATAWQKVKLEREKIALQFAQQKMEGRD